MWCGGGGGGGGGVGFLPIIIPHQPSCFVLFCVVGWIVATVENLKEKHPLVHTIVCTACHSKSTNQITKC